MSRPTVACAVIAKNEINNIDRWFKSIEGCFDQYVFVDTGSTDGTIERAKELGLEVYHFDWVYDFSAARNFAFSKATTDYIFWNDLDDALDNSESFKLWRDTAMILGDYHMVPYHYSLDDKGNPTCTFLRERVVKNGKGMKWKYFLHEGIIPSTNDGVLKTLPVHNWSIRHLRSAEDLNKDRGRNLGIFEKNNGDLDSRMTYYYGKELFEADKVDESIPVLEKALVNADLEPHDRILGMQYLCYAYMRKDRFDQAIGMGLTGLQLAPNRAEFFAIIGDCYLKKNELINAIPSFHAAKAAVLDQSTGVNAAIFHHKDLYTSYPRNQLARIYAHLGDINRAKEQAQEGVDKFQSEESLAILAELNRITTKKEKKTNQVQCGDIVITCPMKAPYLWDADEQKKKAMGGSETAAIEMAHWLHKLSGRPVKIFNERAEAKTIDGVEYLPLEQLEPYMDDYKPFIHIAWRHNMKLTDAPTFLWCHDLYTPGAQDMSIYKKIMCLTPFHKNYTMVSQGITENKIWVTSNGLNPDKFSESPPKKDPNRFVFSSSPDRGLDRAMRVLDRVREVYPEIKLHVHYGIEHLPKWGHQKLHDELKQMMEDRKDWVIYHGATEQKELMHSFDLSGYCVQPSDFIETSMISALERVCCGVHQIIRNIGGVVDTLGPMAKVGLATMVDSECITEKEHDLYAEKVIEAMKEERCFRGRMDPSDFSWESVARSWLEELPKMF